MEAVMNQQVLTQFEANLSRLQKARQAAREGYIKRLVSGIKAIGDTENGMAFLYQHAPALDEAGFFRETVWENPRKLGPSLVGGTLKGESPTCLYELVSELRMLSYAKGKATHPKVTAKMAHDFLQDVLVHNLDLAFPKSVEADIAASDDKVMKRAQRLFKFIMQEIPLEGIKDKLTEEVELICLQRPISTKRVIDILHVARKKMALNPDRRSDKKLLAYVRAAYEPSEAAREHNKLSAYKDWLEKLSEEALKQECRTLDSTMTDTGLVSRYHAVLLRFLCTKHTHLVPVLLGVNPTGRHAWKKHEELVLDLIAKAIYPVTCQSIYGLARMLEDDVFSREPVVNGLKRLLTLDIAVSVKQHVLKSVPDKVEVSANALLTAATISVLGQPLGVGQGMNPTCQAARGISLWSQHAPGKLLNMITHAARDNYLEFRFDGQLLNSDDLPAGLAPKLDYNLDAVSIVLVPHLDRIYNEMMRRAALRGEDGHKWVNPALYGHWIPTGFSSVFDQITQTVKTYDVFARKFYASHHPRYNGGHNLVYPNPVGIFVTTANAELLGFHAVSIQRVAEDPTGDIRIYFLNPNNEGRQDWGQGIKPSVHDHGERPGESSLPFAHFAARLYAFHYHPAELGELSDVSDRDVEKVERLARESWGQSYTWL